MPRKEKAAKKPSFSLLGGLVSWFMRTRAQRFASGKTRAHIPDAPCVSVGGIGARENGRVLLSAWILGWALAKKLSPVVAAPPIGGSPSQPPFLIEPGSDYRECGAEAHLLAKFRPEAKVLADKDLARACRGAAKLWGAGLYLLHDGFSRLEVARQTDIVLLGPADLGEGFNRVRPSGSWREGASALARADAFVLYMDEHDLELYSGLVAERLGAYEKPVFNFSFKIWQVREPGVGPVAGFEEEPYILVCGDGEQELASRAAEEFLGQRPRLKLTFPDDHRPTSFDAQKVAAEAARMRCPYVLCAPKQAVWLSPLGIPKGPKLFVYDPEIRFGPPSPGYAGFGEWWGGAWRSLLEKRFDAKT